MKASQIRVCVLRIEGTNCEEESYLAFRRLGTKPEKVHLKQLIGMDVSHEEKRSLSDYHVLVIPGGFSSGDYVRAGAIFAARMKSRLSKDLVDFVKSGKPLLGICNGFQILVETGLLPAMSGVMSEYPEAVLGTNDSGRFECRPTILKKVNRGSCVFETLDVAVRRAFDAATAGDIVLLAPACASFDQFESYEHRGRFFKELVHALAEKKQAISS